MDIFRNCNKTLIISGFVSFATLFSLSVNANPAWYTYVKPSFDAGIMAGYTGGPRRGVVVNTTNNSFAMDSGAQDSSEAGLQLRLLLGSENRPRPFFYLNGVKPIGAPITMKLRRQLPPGTTDIKLTLANNWISRLGIGATTPWLYNTFQLGIGVAGAVMNQTLKTFINSTSYSQSKTSVRPSIMGSVTWDVCQTCLAGKRAQVSAQLTADSQPVVNNDNLPSSLGTLNSHVQQAWVPRGDLIFSIALG